MATKNAAKKKGWSFERAEGQLRGALTNLDQAFSGLNRALAEAGHGIAFKGEVVLFNEAEWDPKSEKFIAGFDFRFGGVAQIVHWRTWEG
jgi:hypothetical protein